MINIASAVLIIVILFVGILYFLKKYTHHGETQTVPDLQGLSIEDVSRICDEKNLRFKVIDSVYMPDVEYFTVVEQTPPPISKVKKNRMIYLTICSDEPPKVKLPNVIDVSLRQATVMLKNEGLKIGELRYKPDIAKNVVLKIEREGKEIEPGTIIRKGSEIDLVLGDGLTSEKVHVPSLYGRTLDEAIFVLSGVGLNVGFTIFDDKVEDSSKAIIWKQDPLPNPTIRISQGEIVNVYLTNYGTYKLKEIERMANDTTNTEQTN